MFIFSRRQKKLDFKRNIPVLKKEEERLGDVNIGLVILEI